MATAAHIRTAAERQMANQCLFNGLAVIGSTATAFTTTGAGSITVAGVMRNIAAQTNTALAALVAADLPASQVDYVQPTGSTGFVQLPVGTTCYYVIGANVAGTIKVVQGSYDGLAIGSGGYAVGKSVIPDIPLGFTAFAVMKVVSGAAVFLAGTTALTGVATFINVGLVPVATTF